MFMKNMELGGWGSSSIIRLGSSGLDRGVESGMVTSERYIHIIIPRNLNVTLFGEKVFADVIKLRISR